MDFRARSKMPATTIHLFAGNFGSLEAAKAFAERDWGDAPSEDDAPEIWSAWESEFPKWPLPEELGCYLDEDFIELHFGSQVEERLQDTTGLSAELRERVVATCDTLILLFSEHAFGGFEVELRSTPRLEYLGAFEERW